MASIQIRMEGEGLTFVGGVPLDKVGEVLAFLMQQAQVRSEKPEAPVRGQEKVTRQYKKQEKKPVVQIKSGRGHFERRKKPCCGSTGSRHFKTCPQYGTPASDAPVRGEVSYAGPSKAALGPDRYKAIREAMRDKEFQSARYALVNKVSPKEVNAAVRSKDYDDYLEIRNDV